MIAGFSLHNLWVWMAQVFIVASIGLFLPALFRIRHPWSKLIYCRLLLAAVLLLPLIQPLKHEIVVTGLPDVAATVASTDVTPTSASPEPMFWTWSSSVMATLLAGFVVRAGWLGGGLWQLRRMRNSSRVLSPRPDSIASACEAAKAQAQFCISESIQGPVTFGFRRPVVLLPQSFRVTAKNAQDGNAPGRVSITDDKGEYRFSSVEPGTYRLSAELVGLRTQTYNTVPIGAIQRVRLNFALRSGSSEALPIAAIDIKGLSDPLLSELVQRLRVYQGRSVSSELLDEMKASINAAGFEGKLVQFTVYKVSDASRVEITLGDGPTTASRIRVGGNVMAANLIQQTPPVYPNEARDARITGVVVLEVQINKQGRVESATVVTGHPFFRQPAIEAVQQWVYRPMTVQGQPVDVVTTVAVNFVYQN